MSEPLESFAKTLSVRKDTPLWLLAGLAGFLLLFPVFPGASDLLSSPWSFWIQIAGIFFAILTVCPTCVGERLLSGSAFRTPYDLFGSRLCKNLRPVLARVFGACEPVRARSGRPLAPVSPFAPTPALFDRRPHRPVAGPTKVHIFGKAKTYPLCLHGLHQRHDSQDLHHAFQIVGQHVEAHLRADLGQGPGQKMCRTHPGLDRAERMFGRLPSNVHLFRRDRKSVV